MRKIHILLFIISLLSFAASVNAQPLIISEFRVRGPNGANDEYIEIYNNSNTSHTVAGGGTGYAVAASDGVARGVIPNGTVIPARGHYLIVNSVGYSLASYPAGNGTSATGDATYTTDIPDNAGIAIFNTSIAGNFTLANRLDAVGSTSEPNTLYKEGTGYNALTPFSIDYCFHRREVLGLPVDNNDNAADFKFEDTNGTSAGAGQSLGAPGPENMSSPVSHPGGIVVTRLDAAAGISAPPNFVRDFTSDPANNSTFGTMDFRLKVTNNTGGNVTRLRLRIVDLSTFPSPSGIADLRPRTSTAVVVTTSSGNVTVNGTTLEQPPSQPNGGGINSSMGVGVITLATPLTNGASTNIRILLGIQQTGSIKFDLLVETLPGAGGGNAGSGTGASAPIRFRGNDQNIMNVTPVPANLGDVIISEFRLRGPSGANDEYVELYNKTNNAIIVSTTDGSSGWALAASTGGTRFVVPNGTVIPAHGHYLGVNSTAYSLGAYPSGNGTTAAGDVTFTSDIPDNAGIALFNTSNSANFAVGTRMDAVGSTSEANTLYKEGTGYPALTPFSIDYCFHRNEASGLPADANNNAADFRFQDTNGTSAGAGQSLGAPGPQNLSSPVNNPGGIVVTRLDMAVPMNAPPNSVRDFTSNPANNSTFGTVDIRLKVTNNTGAPVTRFRFRIVDVSTFPSPSGTADLRPRTSTAVVATTSSGNVTVQGTTLEQPPSQPNGGGINSSMSLGTITLATPLANGGSENVRLLFGSQQNGNIKIDLLVEALPEGSAGNAGSGSGTIIPISFRGNDANVIMGLCPVITVTNPATATGTVGTAFSQTFTQTGGTTPVSFTTSSTLPTGLTLSTGGVLSGTPTQTGTFPITVTVTDNGGCTGTSTTYNLVISCASITVTNPATTTGTAGTAFSQTFTRTGGTAPVTFTTASTLPTGFTLSTAGVLSGTTTQTGTFPIVVTVTDANSCTGTSATYNLVINCPTLTHTNVLATPSSVCLGSSTVITATANNGVVSTPVVTTTSSGAINLAITDNSPAGVNSTISVPAAAIANASGLSVRLNIGHSWVGDLIFTLTSPCGTSVILNRPGVPASTFGNSNNLGTTNAASPPAPPSAVYTFDISAAAVIPETALGSGVIPAGSYRPSDATGNPHNFSGITFPCSAAGNWTLNVSDNGAGDIGVLTDWAIITTTGGGNYTHTLTGPGTITQNTPTGANNRNASFNVAGLPVGNHSFSLTSTDPSGCSVTTSPINVTVNPLPTITCPANITRNSDPGICGAVVTFAATSTGTPAPVITYSHPSGSVFPVGTTTVTATATNACGAVSCTFTVTVVDNQPPVITCPSTITVNAAAGTCAANVSFTVPATDNCATISLSQSSSTTITPLNSISCNNGFGHTNNSYWRAYQLSSALPVTIDKVTFGIEDAIGAGGTQTVNVRLYTSAGAFPGGTRTQVASQSVAVPNQSGTLFTTTLSAPATVPGNSILVVELNTPDGQVSGNLFFIGSNTAAETGPSYISAADCGVAAPTTMASLGFPGVRIILNASGFVSVPVVSVPASGSSFPVGTTQVTSTATDGAGNVATCTFNVVVVDNQAPTITCPANITATTPAGSCTASVVSPNPVTADNCGISTLTWAITGATTGTSATTGINNVGTRTFNIGVSTVTYTIRDLSGNTSTCSYTVTVNDGQLPVINTQPANRTVCAGSNTTFTVVAVTAPNAGGQLNYQWQLWNGTTWNNVAGATSATLTLNGVTHAMNDNSYRVIVTGLCTAVTSNFATLRVNPLPTISITATPLGVLTPGQTTNLTTTTNQPGGSYVWLLNGQPTGATGPTLSGLTVDQAGSYTVRYTDPNGCVNTSSAVEITAQQSDLMWVYPNPNFGQFQVRVFSTGNTPFTVNVYDSKGSRVFTRTANPTQAYTSIPVDLGMKSMGVYVVELRDASGKQLGTKLVSVNH